MKSGTQDWSPTPVSVAVTAALQGTQRGALALLAGAALLLPAVALAQAAPTEQARDKEGGGSELTELATVTVTARVRKELLQDVPLSVSVVSGHELERLESNDLGAITKRAANVSWNQGNQRTSSLSIRGIGKIGQTEAQDPSVGVIVDGVSYAYNAMSSFDFFDLDAVEVTRGPQGTLLGKNSNLGVINIATRKPQFTPGADYAVTYGEQDTLLAKFAGGGGLIDDVLAWRASFAVNKGRGDIRNAYSEDNTYQNKDRFFGRVQFLYKPTEDLELRLSADATPRAGENTNGRTYRTPTPTTYANGTATNLASDAVTRLGRPWFQQKATYSYDEYLSQSHVNNDGQQPVISGTNGSSLEANWSLANGYTLTSISAYRNYHFNAFYNDEGTPFDIQRSSGVLNNYNQTSQELRITSPTGKFIDFQAGLYGILVNHNFKRRIVYGDDAGAWFANAAQYTALAGPTANGGGRYLAANALNGVRRGELQDIHNESFAVFGQVNWHFTDQFTLTTGLRFTREDRTNRTNILVEDSGYGSELNPVFINQLAPVQLGGFDSVAFAPAANDPKNPGNVLQPGDLYAGNTAAQVGLANATALKYFGVATYAALSAAQRKQVAASKAIRLAQLGVLWNNVDAEPFRKTQPAFVVSPSYKINDNITSYVSLQYGEKAGISQTVNGVSYLTRPEKSGALEWGLKSILLGKTLVLNGDIYYSRIKDYQQAVQVFDDYTTTIRNDGTLYYTAATGNAERVVAKGIELDGAYTGIPFTTLRFAGSYNDAKYDRFTASAQPLELGFTGNTPYRDVSGLPLAGSSKWSYNVGADLRVPLPGNHFEFHGSTNVAYFSRSNSDLALSSYGWLPAFTLVDLGVGIGTSDGRYDLSVIAKNLFDDKTPLLRTWNSYTPANPRWLYVQFSGRL